MGVAVVRKAPVQHRIKMKYTPHKGQKRIHGSRVRFRVVACGRRFGKTLMACNEIVKFALEHINANCAWVAPWFKQSKIVYRLIRKAFAKTGTAIIVRKSDSELRFEFANGSVIQFFSAENYDSLRGDGYHFIVIDEAADALRDPKMWTDAIRPALSDTGGVALIIGTPKGRNLFFQLFNRGNDPEYPDWACFHAVTADNPYIPKAEIETAKKELPEDTYHQEYDAQFLEESAGVFRRISAILAGSLDPGYEPEYQHVYVVGWDPAKYTDYSVVTVMDVTARKVVWWDRFHHQDYTHQVDRVVAVASRFRAFVLMDSTGPG
jgi:phage terminase large subunit-like protein